MNEILQSPIFGISITIFSFYIGGLIYNKVKFSLLSPFILSLAFIISILLIFKIPTEYYNKGGSMIKIFTAPATCAIAIPMYHKLKVMKENFIPILIGTFVGALVSIISIVILCKLFGLDENIQNSILPKSVTAAIAVDLAVNRDAIPSITITCVVLTGIFGSIFSPLLIKLLKLKNPVSIGIAIGTSSHTIGTSKALELGETEGALSGISLGLTGIMTVLIMLFI